MSTASPHVQEWKEVDGNPGLWFSDRNWAIIAAEATDGFYLCEPSGDLVRGIFPNRAEAEVVADRVQNERGEPWIRPDSPRWIGNVGESWQASFRRGRNGRVATYGLPDSGAARKYLVALRRLG